MSTCDVIHLAVEFWRSWSVPLLPPATGEEVAAVFAELNSPVSRDVCELYSIIGGFKDSETDERLWSLWPLDLIRKENQDRPRPASIVWFADYFICSHLYCFHYKNPDVSAVYIDHCSPESPPYLIADSVAEFFERYLRNPDEVEAW